jgi:tRNA U34 5-methylaminomethyl-2-thiouridine-forming methyltransferase MnmC
MDDNIFNEEYQEHYKSTTGAVEEAMEKFVKPCLIPEIARKGKICILDIGFGLGYNAIAAIDAALSANTNCEIKIVSLEKNLILDRLMTLKPGLKNYGIIKKLEYDPITKSYLYEDKNIYMQIRIGLAQELVKKIRDRFDTCFLDPFSPRKNPELWNEEFISGISRLMKPDARLATYSCARAVRDNLKNAGFIVADGPKIGRRGPSTVATFKKG